MLTKRQIFPMRLIYVCLIGFLVIGFIPLNAQQENKTMHPPPVIGWSVSNICYGDTTYFTNYTTGEINDTWSIYEQVDSGDSLIYTCTTYNMKFLFPETARRYKVELMSFNGHTVYLDRVIVYDSLTNAFFDYQACNSQFTNLSRCYTSCVWDFGDGSPTSTETNPSHFYDSTGTYTAKLKVTNGTKVDSIELSFSAYVVNPFKGGFQYFIEGDSVLFVSNDSLYGLLYEYHWAFGDGEVADLNGTNGGPKLRHHYAYKDSTYTVFLLRKTYCVKKYVVQNVYVPDNTPVIGTHFFPNPVSEIYHITSDRKTELTDIKIMNYMGQELPILQVLNKPKGYDLDLSTLPTGFYFLKLYFGEEVYIRRLIKQ
ncbi:MAG TPA: PKD domain-containing protein [Bacteroidia bacterium]|nr:PKD domain-containing protein [Bacteroidia bacterium]